MALHGCFDLEKITNGKHLRKTAVKSFYNRNTPGRRVRAALRKSQRGLVVKVIEIEDSKKV